MAERKRKVTYYNEENPFEKKLLVWAESKGNYAKYIKGLIGDDMQKEQTGLDPKLIEWIEKRIGNLQMVGKVETQKRKIDFSFIKEG